MIKIFIAETESKITSDSFIEFLADNYLGIKHEKLTIGRNEYGKPVLVNFPDIHYNISHTKGLIACAISDSCVGIDIERIRPFNKRIPERFFTRNELEYVYIEKEEQDIRFYEIWTQKEAYVKWLGKGMAVPFESFNVFDDKRIYAVHFDGFVVSICSEAIHEIKADEFIKIALQ